MTEINSPNHSDPSMARPRPLTFFRVWFHCFLLIVNIRSSDNRAEYAKILYINKGTALIGSICGNALIGLTCVWYFLSFQNHSFIFDIFMIFFFLAPASLVLTYFWYVFRPNVSN